MNTRALNVLRRRKKPQYKSFRLTRRIKPNDLKQLPTVLNVLTDTLRHIAQYKKQFFGIALIYVVLSFVFVKGFANTVDIGLARQQLVDGLGITGIVQNLTLAGIIATSSGAAVDQATSVYQSIIVITTILATIWLYRQTFDKKTENTILVRQPYYEGMSQVVPFVLVLCVIGLQLLPMLVGLSIFSTVQSNGLAATAIELVVWGLLAFLLSLLTFYMLSSSLFALLIVTLPQTKPLDALRSARKVVAFRRWQLMRKILVLLVIVAIVIALVLVAVIAVIPILAEFVFIVLSGISLLVIVGCGYKMYRSLL